MIQLIKVNYTKELQRIIRNVIFCTSNEYYEFSFYTFTMYWIDKMDKVVGLPPTSSILLE